MKKQIIKFNIFLFLFVFTFFLVLPNYNVVKASESSFEDDIKSFVNKDTFVDKSTNDYTISDFQQKYKQIKVLQYLPFKSINSNDRKQKEIVKYSYYKDAVLHIDVLSSDSFDKNEVLKEIDSFYNDRTDYEKSSSNNFKMSANSELFVPITSGYKRIISKPYGYMDHSYEVKKYRSSDISSLYIVETNSDFIPGSIAYKNGNTSFDEKMRCNFGFIHLDVPQAIVEIDQSMIRKGGVPVFKDAWPINNPGMVTISSTYNVNTTIGNSYKNGFSLDNISIENQSEYGVNIGYTYSKSYTNQEPRLSTQHDAENYNKYQWSFQYEDCVNGEETFHLKTGYMFEMNNSGHGLNGEGQFGLEYRFSMQVASCSKFLFWWNRSIQNPFNGFLDVNWW